MPAKKTPPKKPMAVKKSAPNKKAQDAASKKASQMERNTSSGRADSKAEIKSLKSKATRGMELARDLKTAARKLGGPNKASREVSAKDNWKTSISQTQEKTKEMRTQRAATRANVMPAESAPSKRGLGNPSSKDVKSTTKAVKPKKPQAKLSGKAISMANKATKGAGLAAAASAVLAEARRIKKKVKEIEEGGISPKSVKAANKKYADRKANVARAKAMTPADKKAKADLAAKKRARVKKK